MVFAQLFAFAILAFAVSDALTLKNCGKFFRLMCSNAKESYQPNHDWLDGSFSPSLFLHKELEISRSYIFVIMRFIQKFYI